MSKYDVIHRTGSIHSVSLRRQRTEPRPQVTCAKKFGEDRTCRSEDVTVDRQTSTDRQTDRHAHHNAPLPYRGRSNYVKTNEIWSLLMFCHSAFILARTALPGKLLNDRTYPERCSSTAAAAAATISLFNVRHSSPALIMLCD